MEFWKSLKEYKTKNEIVFLLKFEEKIVQWVVGFSFRERKCDFSLDFLVFGSSVLNGARSQVGLRGEGYAWTSIWWSSDNSKR